jgi:hypothetical protein
MTRGARSRRTGLLLIATGLLWTGVLAGGFAVTVSAAPVAASRSQTAAASAQSKPLPPTPNNLEPLEARYYTGILGKKIMGPDNKELGLVVDVLIDDRGHPRAAVIDFGGFLGVGSRKIAVDWRLLHLTPGQPDWKIWLNLGRADIQGAPEYKPDAALNKMVGPLPKAAPSPRTDK